MVNESGVVHPLNYPHNPNKLKPAFNMSSPCCFAHIGCTEKHHVCASHFESSADEQEFGKTQGDQNARCLQHGITSCLMLLKRMMTSLISLDTKNYYIKPQVSGTGTTGTWNFIYLLSTQKI